VLETIEALPQVFASAQDLSHGKPYRLGLVSIAMRSNPYGAAVADNPDQVRQTMAMFDPRQRGLFGAAFAVGVLAATEAHRVDSLALAAPSGPFGILSETQPITRPYFDENPTALVYPIYHVIRAATAMQGKKRYAINNLPNGLQGIAASDGFEIHLMITNLGNVSIDLTLPGSAAQARVCVLDASTFEAAVHNAGWLDDATFPVEASVGLDPNAILFATLAEAD